MLTASPTTLREPRGTCGEYRLVARIGAGGMANVDLAVAAGANGQNQLVVLKRLFRNLAEDAGSEMTGRPKENDRDLSDPI